MGTYYNSTVWFFQAASPYALISLLSRYIGGNDFELLLIQLCKIPRIYFSK